MVHIWLRAKLKLQGSKLMHVHCWATSLLQIWMRSTLRRTTSRKRQKLLARANSIDELPAGVTISTVHQLGVFLSRLWPCAYDGGRGDSEAQGRFEAGTRALLVREDLWADDFAACSHWVPQYLWLGYWFAGGMR